MNGKIAFSALAFGSAVLFGCAARSVEETSLSPSSAATEVEPSATASNTNTHTPVALVRYAFPAEVTATAVPWPVEIISPENAARTVPISAWGKGTVDQVAWSPDGGVLAVASPLGIFIYDAESLAELGSIKTESSVACIAFSPDSRILAAGLWNGDVRILRSSDGTWIRTLSAGIGASGERARATSIAFSGDGSLLAVGSDDGPLPIYQVSDGAVVALLNNIHGYGDFGISSLAFSPDGQTLVIGRYSEVSIWRIWESKNSHRLGSVGSPHYFRAAVSPDGQFIASSEQDGSVVLWRASDESRVRWLESEMEGRGWKTIAFSPDSTKLAIGSTTGRITLRSISDGAVFRALDGHARGVISISFSPDGSRLASGSVDGTVRRWRISDGSQTGLIDGHNVDLNDFAFSPDGRMLASESSPGSVAVRRVSDGGLIRLLEGNSSAVISSVAFSRDGTLLAAGWWDGTGKVWRLEDGSVMWEAKEEDNYFAHFAFSPDGTIMAFGVHGSIRLLDPSDGTEIRILTSCESGGCNDLVQDMVFSPDSRMVAVLFYNTIIIWGTADGKLIQTFEIEGCALSSLAFSPDGDTLAAGSWGWSVYLWSLPGGVRQPDLFAERSNPIAVAFSPDGGVLAVGLFDGGVQFWSMEKRQILTTLPGHALGVTAVGFSPDGRILGSSSWDGTIRLWGVR